MTLLNLSRLSITLLAFVFQTNSFAEDFTVHHASKQYDVVIKNLTCDGESNSFVSDLCSGNGSVDILTRDSSQLIQTISPEYLRLSKKATVFSHYLNSKPRNVYGKTYSVVLEDFNFDGHDDIALWTGDEAGYGGPSYDVYLFNAKMKQFAHSKDLSTLATEPYLGLFTIKNKHLITSSKSGCCYHETKTFKVRQNKPILVEKSVEQLSSSGRYLLKTTEQMKNGHWIKTSRKTKVK